MATEGLYVATADFNLARGQQVSQLPPGAICRYADLVGRRLRTVWECDTAEEPTQRTFQVLYLPSGECSSKIVSPQWEMVKVVDDKVGGFIALLVLN